MSIVEPPKVKYKRAWSEAERTAIHKNLSRFVAERKVPGKKDCTQCVKEEEALAQQSWKDVKNFCLQHNCDP